MNLTFLTLTLLFTAAPMGLFFLLRPSLLISNKKVILLAGLAGVVLAVISNSFAARWKLWMFAPEKTPDIFILGFPIELVFLGGLFFACTAAGVIFFQSFFDKK